MRLALADALHLGGVQRIDLGSLLPLFLGQHAIGKGQRLGKDRLQKRVTSNFARDVADHAAKISLQLSQDLACALELFGMGCRIDATRPRALEPGPRKARAACQEAVVSTTTAVSSDGFRAWLLTATLKLS